MHPYSSIDVTAAWKKLNLLKILEFPLYKGKLKEKLIKLTANIYDTCLVVFYSENSHYSMKKASLG